MQQITGISDNPAQVINLTADDGTTVTLTLEYRPQQSGWSVDVLWNGTTPATELNGLRVTVFPNLVRQWKNLLTFGLACITQDGREPLSVDAFLSGYATLLLLNAADVASIESQIFTNP
jgi:hypothetical protein